MNYQKKLDHSYTLGAFPTLELLHHRPETLRVVYLHPNANADLKEKALVFARKYHLDVSDSPRFFKALEKENVFLAAKFSKYTDELSPGNHLLLHMPQVLGNLGTIIRSALAFGIENLGLIGPSCDVFHPNCIRASMGAHFSLRIKHFEDMDHYLSHFQRPIYAFMTGDHPYLTERDYDKPFSLLFGSESSGLPLDFAQRFLPTKIKMSHQVDSLNLSLAVGIALHHLYTK